MQQPPGSGGGLHPGHRSEDSCYWIAVYGTVVDVVNEEDPERGHLATESIDDFGELYLGQRPYPLREEGQVRVLFLIRADKIVTFGAPS